MHCKTAKFIGILCLFGDEFAITPEGNPNLLISEINGEAITHFNHNTIGANRRVNPLLDICDEWKAP